MGQTEWITRNAIDFIGKTDKASPLFAHIGYMQPHGPFCPHGEAAKNVDESQIPPPAPIEWLNDPLHPTEGARKRMPDDWRTTRLYYMADLTHLDEQLGQVTKALRESGRLDNTYLILLSDHGELFLDHGFTGKGERHYDACVRVPIIVSGPGPKAGLARSELLQLEDTFQTVMEAAGLAAPAPKAIGPYLKLPADAERLPGRSLLPLCPEERMEEWRYTLYPGGQGEQLFSLLHDPDEQRNLAAEAGYARVRTEMRDRILECLILQDYPHKRQDLCSLGVY